MIWADLHIICKSGPNHSMKYYQKGENFGYIFESIPFKIGLEKNIIMPILTPFLFEQ